MDRGWGPLPDSINETTTLPRDSTSADRPTTLDCDFLFANFLPTERKRKEERNDGPFSVRAQRRGCAPSSLPSLESRGPPLPFFLRPLRLSSYSFSATFPFLSSFSRSCNPSCASVRGRRRFVRGDARESTRSTMTLKRNTPEFPRASVSFGEDKFLRSPTILIYAYVSLCIYSCISSRVSIFA